MIKYTILAIFTLYFVCQPHTSYALRRSNYFPVCPVARCVRPPPGACTEPNYILIGGRKCPMCYKIVPCEQKCPLAKCAAPPEGACTEPNYVIIRGKRCPICYKIVPCNQDTV